jgi:hypothetical protein
MHTSTLLLFFFAFSIYFLPALVAYNRKHPKREPITLLNFFLGWMLIPWVIALCWATTHT